MDIAWYCLRAFPGIDCHQKILSFLPGIDFYKQPIGNITGREGWSQDMPATLTRLISSKFCYIKFNRKSVSKCGKRARAQFTVIPKFTKKSPWKWVPSRELTYCWWTKSCTTKDDDYPIIYRVLTIPGGAGFLPSRVSPSNGIFEVDFPFPRLVGYVIVYL